MATQPVLPAAAHDFVTLIRTCLLDAAQSEELVTAPRDVIGLLKHETTTNADGNTTVTVFGGATFDKPQDQNTAGFFLKSDGARLSFTVTAVYPNKEQPFLHSYRFHLRFVAGSNPEYVRIDLNRGVSGDALREPRAHVHIGAEKLRVAAPVMNPLEVLEKLVYGTQL